MTIIPKSTSRSSDKDYKVYIYIPSNTRFPTLSTIKPNTGENSMDVKGSNDTTSPDFTGEYLYFVDRRSLNN